MERIIDRIISIVFVTLFLNIGSAVAMEFEGEDPLSKARMNEEKRSVHEPLIKLDLIYFPTNLTEYCPRNDTEEFQPDFSEKKQDIALQFREDFFNILSKNEEVTPRKKAKTTFYEIVLYNILSLEDLEEVFPFNQKSNDIGCYISEINKLLQLKNKNKENMEEEIDIENLFQKMYANWGLHHNDYYDDFLVNIINLFDRLDQHNDKIKDQYKNIYDEFCNYKKFQNPPSSNQFYYRCMNYFLKNFKDIFMMAEVKDYIKNDFSNNFNFLDNAFNEIITSVNESYEESDDKKLECNQASIALVGWLNHYNDTFRIICYGNNDPQYFYISKFLAQLQHTDIGENKNITYSILDIYQGTLKGVRYCINGEYLLENVFRSKMMDHVLKIKGIQGQNVVGLNQKKIGEQTREFIFK